MKWCVVLVALAGAVCVSAAERGLGNSFAKLRNEGTLNVGYFGGSITAGAGASKGEETSYRALTTRWFRQQFPSAKINEINAAIGGTGSDLGAFRCEQDLLAKKPDLVFVEFAVNDGGGAEERITRSMEGIVRQILRSNPQCDVVFIYTTTKALAPAYEKGEDPKAVQYDHAVAEHYGIPEVNVGKPLWQQIHDGKETWETLTKDTVHPNDKGYAIYFEVIRGFLEKHRDDAPEKRALELPAPLVKDPIEHGKLVDAWTAEASGWEKQEKSMAGRYPHQLVSGTAGAELKFKFKGDVIGIYWLMGPDSGDVEWSVDGSAPKRRSAWDKYCLQFSRANDAILEDHLSPGEHVLSVKVLAEKNEQSKGTVIRIGAFMVDEDH